MENHLSLKEFRSFGLIVGGVSAVIGVWPLVGHGGTLRPGVLVLAGVLVMSAFFAPWILRPLYRGWMVIGAGLGWINTRILLSVVFFGLFVPMGILRRWILRRDPLQLEFDPQAETYREVRQPRDKSHVMRQF